MRGGIIMRKKTNRTEKEIEEIIRKVNGAMALEGMPLTKEIKNNIRNCFAGRSTLERERQKVIERYNQLYE